MNVEGRSPERTCFRFKIRPEAATEYERRHDELWPELAAALREAGFTNYTLFRDGSQITAYCECLPTAAEAFARLADTEVNRRWSESLQEIIVGIGDDPGWMQFSTEIWHQD